MSLYIRTTALAIFLLCAVCILLGSFFIGIAEAGNTVTVKRGFQAPTANIWWKVEGGATSCTGSFNGAQYPVSGDNIRSGWLGSHAAIASLSFNQINEAGTYVFRCTHNSNGAVWDESTMIVEDCSVYGEVWNGTNACVAPPPTPITTVNICNVGGTACVNNGGTKTINIGDQVEVTWNGGFADSCTAIAGPADFAVSGAGGVDNTVTEPGGGSSQVFSVRCSNVSGNNDATVTLTTAAAPVLSGTLSASSATCTVLPAGTTCPIDLTWTTTNPVTTSFIWRDDLGAGTPLVTANNGGPSAYNVRYAAVTGNGSRTFYLQNNGINIAQQTVTANCTVPETWVGGVCTPPPAFADLVPSSVTVSSGAVIQGGSVTIGTGDINNVSTVTAGPYAIGGFYFDINNDGSAEFTVNAGNVGVDTLGGGQNSVSIPWTVPVGTPTGTYRVSYLVDTGLAVDEGASGETNNFSGWSTTLTITAAANPLPVVDAGNTPIAATVPDTVQPIGASATDADGIASISWSFVAPGPGPTPVITNSTTFTPTFSNMTTPGTYTFRLTATDNLGASNSDTMQVNASAATAFICTGGNPTGGSLCAGDDSGLSADTPKRAVNSCTAPTKCEYTCGLGYTFFAGACEPPRITRFQICDDPAGMGNCSSPVTKTINVPASTPLYVHWDSNYTDDCVRQSGPADFSTGNLTSGSDAINANATPGNFSTYRLLCSKDGVGVSADTEVVTINVNSVTPDISSNSSLVKINNPVTISWNTNGNDITTCTLSGGTLTNAILTASAGVGSSLQNISGRTTFRINCGGILDSVTVDVIPEGGET